MLRPARRIDFPATAPPRMLTAQEDTLARAPTPIIALLLLGACASPAKPVGPQDATTTSAAVVRDADLPRCATARCWHERAAQALRLGALDVAAASRGHAYAQEPDEPALLA